jgi:hypothetical protein
MVRRARSFAAAALVPFIGLAASVFGVGIFSTSAPLALANAGPMTRSITVPIEPA